MISIELQYTKSEVLDYCTAGLDNIEFIHEGMLIELIYHWKQLLIKQRLIIDIPDKKTLVVGDLHGDYEQFKKAIFLFDNENYDQIIFNGDIIDRGSGMLECLIHLIIRQIQEPNKVFFLRGNHEIRSINEFYGFKDTCEIVYGNLLYSELNLAFDLLPLATKFGSWAFICHGGIPVEPIFFHLMRLEPKPQDPLEKPPYGELLWNDPREKLKTYSKSYRGENIFYFGQEIVDNFLKLHELKLIVRSHEAYSEGYRWFFNKKVLSIFSSNIGPYSNVDPHFAELFKGEVKVIKSADYH